MKKMILMSVLMAMAIGTRADKLSVEDFTLQAGETREVAVMLSNTEHAYAAFQFDMVLPEDVSIAKDEKGRYVAALNAERADDHALNVSLKGERTYRFMSFSMTNTAFSGTSGALVYVTLTADAGYSSALAGGSATAFKATLTSQVFTEPDGTQHRLEDTTFTIAPETGGEKCATPTISFVGGELMFSCETEGVEFVSEVTSNDAGTHNSNKVRLGGGYKVSVYATKAGYNNSDVATLEFTLGSTGGSSDVNGDGKVDVADITAIISAMAGK